MHVLEGQMYSKVVERLSDVAMNACIFKVGNRDTNYEYSKAGMQK